MTYRGADGGWGRKGNLPGALVARKGGRLRRVGRGEREGEEEEVLGVVACRG